MDPRIEEEKIYRFDTFSHEDALTFGMNVLQIVKEENLKNVRIRVKYEDDIVFQYLMNGKKGEKWLDRKENTVRESQHSSLYTFDHDKDFEYMKDNDDYAVCGGGFPLIVNDEVKGAFLVSGLEHTEDHNLIIKALRKMKGE